MSTTLIDVDLRDRVKCAAASGSKNSLRCELRQGWFLVDLLIYVSA